ncbi:MAG: hypothetical protein M3342_15405 [Bacteroidota bacterium]|nr:hypothetical protein [Bacteroidota bacterium]
MPELQEQAREVQEISKMGQAERYTGLIVVAGLGVYCFLCMHQNPEQQARDRIDAQLTACGWTLPHKKALTLHAAHGIAVREYPTNVGPADYLLFGDKKPVGVIEAKRAEEGLHLTVPEDQLQYCGKVLIVNSGQPC